MGVLEAFSWIDSLSIRNVVVKCDSLLSVSAINNSRINLLEVGDIIDGCRDRLRNRSDISLLYVKKANPTGLPICWLGVPA